MTAYHALALVTLLVAHLIRAARQANLFAADERPRTIHLMVGLSIAFVINAVVPFRLGEVARGLYVAMRANLSVGRVFATILAERLTDLIVVFAGVAALSRVLGGDGWPPELTVIGGGILAIIGAVWALRQSGLARRVVWFVGSVFNDRIRLSLAEFAWSTVQLLAGRSLWRPRYLAMTAAMWGMYVAAYAAFARATGYPLGAVIATMVDSPLQSLLDRSRDLGSAIVLFTSLAALLILILGLAADWRGVERSVARVRRLGLPLMSSTDPTLRNAFVDRGDHGAMLRSHFTDADPVVATFGRHGLGDAIVHRILPGGSDAITAVVAIAERFGIRKFATGVGADKLVEQAEWLDCHVQHLPLAEVVDRHGDGRGFRYDMPYHAGARDLYEVVHTTSPGSCVKLLEAVVAGVSQHHAASAAGPCSSQALASYVDDKIVANARYALDFGRLHLPERYRINGEPYAMDEWAPLLDRDGLLARLRTTGTAAIHGDLTFENIIICPDRAPGWYLIDPNPDNVFDSPLIDWAKLMQSLHLGYETVNRGAPARVNGDDVTLLLAQSRVYADLHESYSGLLARQYHAATIREIYLHEIVNYLRLIPYKVRNQPQRALSFFVCAAILIRRYLATEHV